MSDKRQEPRLEINHEFNDLGEFLREYALNISRGGVFVRTRDVLPVGSRVKLKFSVIVEDFETIEGEGEVVRAVKEGSGSSPSGIGVVFTSLTEESTKVLARLFTRPQTAVD